MCLFGWTNNDLRKYEQELKSGRVSDTSLSPCIIAFLFLFSFLPLSDTGCGGWAVVAGRSKRERLDLRLQSTFPFNHLWCFPFADGKMQLNPWMILFTAILLIGASADDDSDDDGLPDDVDIDDDNDGIVDAGDNFPNSEDCDLNSGDDDDDGDNIQDMDEDEDGDGIANEGSKQQ